jgi:hypothetical protein
MWLEAVQVLCVAHWDPTDTDKNKLMQWKVCFHLPCFISWSKFCLWMKQLRYYICCLFVLQQVFYHFSYTLHISQSLIPLMYLSIPSVVNDCWSQYNIIVSIINVLIKIFKLGGDKWNGKTIHVKLKPFTLV